METATTNAATAAEPTAAAQLTIRKASPGDIDALVDTLSQALADDPVTNYMLQDLDDRPRRVARSARMGLVNLVLPHGEIYTAGDHVGVAAWVPPGKGKPSLMTGLRLVTETLSIFGIRGTRRAMDLYRLVEKKHPASPDHWSLMGLGVRPEMQGRGIGTALMRPILEICDRERVPAYLESGNPRNLTVYQRSGFVVREVVEISDGGPKLWMMWREPQAI